jgi:hypothetical protein
VCVCVCVCVGRGGGDYCEGGHKVLKNFLTFAVYNHSFNRSLRR